MPQTKEMLTTNIKYRIVSTVPKAVGSFTLENDLKSKQEIRYNLPTNMPVVLSHL